MCSEPGALLDGGSLAFLPSTSFLDSLSDLSDFFVENWRDLCKDIRAMYDGDNCDCRKLDLVAVWKVLLDIRAKLLDDRKRLVILVG